MLYGRGKCLRPEGFRSDLIAGYLCQEMSAKDNLGRDQEKEQNK